MASGTGVGKTMSFDECHEAALAWLDTKAGWGEWYLLWADEKDERFFIKHQREDISFSISIASVNDQQYFKVTSDAESVRCLLSSCKMSSIQECLESSTTALKNFGACPDENEEDDNDDSDDEDFDDEQYYNECEDDDMEESPREPAASDTRTSESLSGMYATTGSRFAVQRLLSDLRALKDSNGQFDVEGCPREDNLFLWDVQLTHFDDTSVLGKDLAAYAAKYRQKPEVHLEMSFPSSYPMSPPFIRVVRPRFKFLTGHVTIGGSICMELLTKSGWAPTYEIESILVQVRSEIISDPRASLDLGNANRVYTQEEAEAAFKRMSQNYGWE